MDEDMDRRAVDGKSFGEVDVVRNYAFRPPYPEALFEHLASVAPRRNCLLDLGCGPGKVARPMAASFDRVIAVDPSQEMLALARTLENGRARNITWVECWGEDVELEPASVDLVVAANSIHWMDAGRLFPRLAGFVAPDHRVAVVSGDDPFEPPWAEPWQAFLVRWLPLLTGEPFDPKGKSAQWASYKDHLEIIGEQRFLSAPVVQSVDDFIRCQHSRESFAPDRLGSHFSEFDGQLTELLAPFANGGMLTFVVKVDQVCGTIKAN